MNENNKPDTEPIRHLGTQHQTDCVGTASTNFKPNISTATRSFFIGLNTALAAITSMSITCNGYCKINKNRSSSNICLEHVRERYNNYYYKKKTNKSLWNAAAHAITQAILFLLPRHLSRFKINTRRSCYLLISMPAVLKCDPIKLKKRHRYARCK